MSDLRLSSQAPSGSPSGSGKKAQSSGASSQFLMIFLFLMFTMIIVNPDLRNGLGNFVGKAFNPLFAFDGRFPFITLLICACLLIFVSMPVRFFTTNWVKQASLQFKQNALNKELREARINNDTKRLEKITDLQTELMQDSMEMMSSQMKTMMASSVVAIAVFAWLSHFFYETGDVYRYYTLPWMLKADFLGSHIFPNWILMYSVISFPFGQILNNLLKIVVFEKRARSITASAETVVNTASTKSDRTAVQGMKVGSAKAESETLKLSSEDEGGDKKKLQKEEKRDEKEGEEDEEADEEEKEDNEEEKEVEEELMLEKPVEKKEVKSALSSEELAKPEIKKKSIGAVLVQKQAKGNKDKKDDNKRKTATEKEPHDDEGDPELQLSSKRKK